MMKVFAWKDQGKETHVQAQNYWFFELKFKFNFFIRPILGNVENIVDRTYANTSQKSPYLSYSTDQLIGGYRYPAYSRATLIKQADDMTAEVGNTGSQPR